MAHRQRHRGPHPEDHKNFGVSQLDLLQQATGDLCWLLSRGYVNPSALKLVGDRYQLNTRQRTAISRSACSQTTMRQRLKTEVRMDHVESQCIWIDGFNLLTTIEAAMSGGVLLVGQEGAIRDMASMHGSYRQVEETQTALDLIAQQLSETTSVECRWLLDQPVSNSGRLKALIEDVAKRHQLPWSVDVVRDPDPLLAEYDGPVITADGEILDACDQWINFSAELIKQIPNIWLVDLRSTQLNSTNN